MAMTPERTSLKVVAERAILAAVHLPTSRFDPRDPLGELRSLAKTAGAESVGELIQLRDRPKSSTYMGSGKLLELKTLCEATEATLVVFDHNLSPSQIGNIEKIVERKIIDRSELILDIFARRATTKQAQLQVELAQLEYTYPRLRAMWSHLERIGATGAPGIGTRGPGEQQLEIDRRLVQKRRKTLQRELGEIQARKSREVATRGIDHFTVGLVGYTNAGKSTLFNTLTEGGAYADDRLFATLMTRTREWDLGGGQQSMLSDTVGFVRDLPHNLVASFKATLEEATHADLLLLVLDAADPAASMQFDTVMGTLDDLFKKLDDVEQPPRLLLLNKADLLPDNRETLLWEHAVADHNNHDNASTLLGPIAISATQAEHPGIEALIAAVRHRCVGEIQELLLTLPLANAKAINIIEQRAEVLDRDYDNGNGTVTLRTRIGDRQIEQLRASGARLIVEPV